MHNREETQLRPAMRATGPMAAPGKSGRLTTCFAAIVAVLGISILVLYGFDVMRGEGVDSAGLIAGRDFVNMHFGGRLIAGGRPEVLADQEAYVAALRGWAGTDYSVHNWSYPPLMFLPAEGLGALPYPVALALWIGLGGAALWAALRYAGLGAGWAVLVCLSPAGVVNMLTGQNGFFTGALTLAGLVATVRDRPLVAGTSWALLTVKPHLGVLILPFLICRREGAVIVSGAVAFLLMLAASIVVYGLEPWQVFFEHTAPQQRRVVETWGGLLELLMPTFFMQGRSAGWGLTGAYVLHGFGILLAITLLIRAWPSRAAAPREWLAWLVCGTYLLLPYSFVYDLVVFQLVLALWHDTPDQMLRTARMSVARSCWFVLWLLPLLSVVVMALVGIQVLPLVLLVFLWRLGCPQPALQSGMVQPARGTRSSPQV